MNTNIISGLINCLAAIFSLPFVNIRVHSWLKFFPGPCDGHKPQNPLVPGIFRVAENFQSKWTKDQRTEAVCWFHSLSLRPFVPLCWIIRQTVLPQYARDRCTDISLPTDY